MTLWLALRRLLPLLAVLSLALTPVAAPAATAGMHASMPEGQGISMDHHGMAGMDNGAMDKGAMDQTDASSDDMGDMPCCPKAEAAGPVSHESGCGKGCPLMALCLASVASLLPSAPPVPAPIARRASLSWPEPMASASVPKALFPEPPRA